MTTIDDAIKHEEERAADLESTCTLWKSLSDTKGLALPSDYEFCKSDAEDHRQFAAWLKELKALKEEPKGDLISREALKKTLEEIISDKPVSIFTDGIVRAIKVIDNTPAVEIATELQPNCNNLQQKPQSDLINRDDLKRRFAQITYIRFTADMGQGGFEMFSEKEIEDIINKAPAIDISGNEYFPYRSAYFNGVADGKATARPQGEWIVLTDKYNVQTCKCSICGRIEVISHHEFEKIPFCHCGAKMKKGGAE